METQSKTVLFANGIIRSCKTKQLYCTLCMHSPSPGDWQTHIESSSHKVFKERFNSTFEIRKTDLSCKICKKNLNWDQLKIHALQHKLIPWYMPENIYKLFFENQILRLEQRYYCAACKLGFLEWFKAVVHINDIEHLKIIKARSSKCENFSLAGLNLSYKSLVSDGLVSWPLKSIACNICPCVNIALSNIQEHIKGTRHSSEKLKLGLKLNKTLDYSCNNNVELDKENAVPQIHDRPIMGNKKKWPKSERLKKNGVEKFKKKSKQKPDNINHFLQDRNSNITMERDEHTDLFQNCICNICASSAKNGSLLHKHLAQHVAQDLVDSENNENVSDRIFKNRFKHQESRIYPAKEWSDEKPFYALFGNDLSQPNSFPIFENHYIYDMKEKLKELELGLKLCIGTSSELLYCFVCCQDKLKTNYFEHLSSREHSIHQEIMEKDHQLFLKYPDEFSKQSLGLEYIVEISSNNFMCLVCAEKIVEDLLRDHIEKNSHGKNRDERRALVMENWGSIKQRFDCNWYKVESYLCIPCQKGFQFEVNFVAHFKHSKHRLSIFHSKLDLMFDFCEICACLWYGYRQTYSHHCKTKNHLWLLKDGLYAEPELSLKAKELLANPEEYIKDVILRSKEKHAREEIVILDIEKAVKAKFDKINIRVFDSRMTGLDTRVSDVHVFVDCGNMYDKESSSDKRIRCMHDLTDCLKEYPENWDVERLPKCSDIRVHHFSSGLSCDITYDSSLAFIKCFYDIHSSFKKMLIFLEEWMRLCDLSNHSRMSSRIIHWQVIFYLERLSILPCFGTLMEMKMSFDTIAAWEAEVASVFGSLEENHKCDIKELLEGFFEFWAKFDYINDIVCPITGKLMRKRDFTDLGELPESMLSYPGHTTNLLKLSELEIPCMGIPLRVSTIGIQNPFNLQRNVAGDVRKTWLNRFRTFASLSSDLLEDRTMTTIRDTFQNNVRILPD